MAGYWYVISLLVVSLGKALNGIAFSFEWLDWYRWQLDSKTEKVTLLFPVRGTLTNKCVPKPKPKCVVAPS